MNYDFNGTDHLATVDLPEPGIKLDRFQGTTGTYAGYDRFGRAKDQYWKGYNSTSDVDRFKYDHDYAGNRTYRDIDSSIYSTNDKDQVYTYDDLNRLKNSDEGTLSGTTISGTPIQEEDWTLDALGNWSGYVTKTSGTEVLNQARTSNDVNEITNVTESTGPAWVTPAYDAAGNMTTIPKPSDPTNSYTATYDAWKRLVRLSDGANTVAEYEYNGLNQRAVKSIYSNGTLTHKEKYYYNQQWQVLEVRKEVNDIEDSDPLEQYIWQPDYIDSILLRDYDENTDGASLRQYYMTDARFNVTSVVDETGMVLERYHYSPYGELSILDLNFADDADGKSDINNTITFTGRRYDAETGLYYFRNRYYSSQSGLFISRDPISYQGGDNLYGNYFSPYGTDPLGLRGFGFEMAWYNKVLKPMKAKIDGFKDSASDVFKKMSESFEDIVEFFKKYAPKDVAFRFNLEVTLINLKFVKFKTGGYVTVKADGCCVNVAGGPYASASAKTPSPGFGMATGGSVSVQGTFQYCWADNSTELGGNVNGNVWVSLRYSWDMFLLDWYVEAGFFVSVDYKIPSGPADIGYGAFVRAAYDIGLGGGDKKTEEGKWNTSGQFKASWGDDLPVFMSD